MYEHIVSRLLFAVVHRSLSSSRQQRNSAWQRSSSNAQQQQQQQQAVVRQRLEHAELCGFKPIDSPASAAAKAGDSRRQATGKSSRKTCSESSSNPLSGDEYY